MDVRPTYRELTDPEKTAIAAFKRLAVEMGNILRDSGDSVAAHCATERLEEGVMWGVKHLTRPIDRTADDTSVD